MTELAAALTQLQAGMKVAIPTSATTPGVPGQWAADATHQYIYVGDGVTHSWTRTALSLWLPAENTVAPVASGEAAEMDTLTSTAGTWLGSPTLTYQWYRDGVAIAGATASTYTLVSGDLGKMVLCRVTGTNTHGTDTADTNAIGPIGASTTPYLSAKQIRYRGLDGGGNYSRFAKLEFLGPDGTMAAGYTVQGADLGAGSYADAFDSNDATNCAVLNMTGWLGVKYATPQIFTHIRQKADNVYHNSQFSREWVIETRNEDTDAWVEGGRFYTGARTPYEVRTFPINNNADATGFRFYKFEIISNYGQNGADTYFSELEILNGSVNVARDYKALTPAVPGFFNGIKADEANLISGLPGTFKVDFGVRRAATAFNVWFRNSVYKDQGPNIVRLSGSMDDIDYTPIVNPASNPTLPTMGEMRTVSLDPATFAPFMLNNPILAGYTNTVGDVVTATAATKSAGSTIGYVWKRNGVAIAGATASSYTLTAPDIGATITCTATLTSAGGTASYTTTAAIGFRYLFVEALTSGNGYLGGSFLKALDGTGYDYALASNGGVVSAVNYSPNLPSYPVTNLNDGNDSTFTASMASSVGAGKGWQIDMQSVRQIQKLQYRNRPDGFNTESIYTGNIYGKVAAGDAWTILRAINETGWTAGAVRDWILP